MNFSDSSFSNDQVDTSSLPSINEIDFKGLHGDYLTAELIGAGLLIVFLSLGVSIGFFFGHEEMPSFLPYLLLAGLAIMVLLILTSTILGFRRKKYALRQHDIIYKCGWLWRSTTIIPFNRVQHAEVHQGPIERLFNLSSLKVYTAGGSSSDLSISGITFKEAQNMKFYILNKTGVDEEE
jgi:membrane protein YdbS with pleckstrin-like domain